MCSAVRVSALIALWPIWSSVCVICSALQCSVGDMEFSVDILQWSVGDMECITAVGDMKCITVQCGYFGVQCG